MAKTWDYRRGQWKEDEPKPSSADILHGRAQPKVTTGGGAAWGKTKDIASSVASTFTGGKIGGGESEPAQSASDMYFSSQYGDEADTGIGDFARQQQSQHTVGEDASKIIFGDTRATSISDTRTQTEEEQALINEGRDEGPTEEQRRQQLELERKEREEAARREEQDKTLSMVNTMFGTDTSLGYGRGITTGDLRKQIEQFGQLEGEMRSNYTYWENDASGGMPMSTREAYTFLGQAQSRPANRITESEVTPAMYEAIANKQSDGIRLSPAEEAAFTAFTEGKPVYMLEGRPATFQEIFEYSQIQDFRNESMRLIEDYRINKQTLLQKNIEDEYKRALEKQEQDSRERIARLQREEAEARARQERLSRENVAAEERAAREKIAVEDRASAKEIAVERRASDKEIATEQRASDLEIAKDISKITAAGTEERLALTEAGKQERLTQKERIDAEIRMLEDQLAHDKDMGIREMNNRLAVVSREANAQSNLMYYENQIQDERINVQNEWQSLENDKLHFLENKRIDEAIASNQAQEELARDQQDIERESQKLNLIMSISQNPALLYFMNQSGMLATPGETIMGEDVNDLISELTASIDPANMPNIQTYNALGEEEQARVRFRQAATRGVSPEGLENFLTGSSPFTRGRQSTIKVGRA